VGYQEITTDGELRQYCRALSQLGSIAFDTEFVAEDTYRPVLCLVQVAAGDQLAVIDALAVQDITPFWEAIAEPGHETIVHAGRGELEFCLRAIGQRPANLFDVQIAAGLIGMEYPAGYGTLVSRLLGRGGKAHETRTNWQRRPLSQRQLAYALDDVRYLHPIRDALRAKLVKLDRLGWLNDEMAAWQDDIEQFLSQERWRRVPGSAGLSRRNLAVLRELWQWRETEAQCRDKPVRRVLRDDLLVELARRGTADIKRIRAVRGLERGDLRPQLAPLAACIQKALELPEEECPETIRRNREPKHSVLGQFLFAALGSICRQAEVAPNLVATPGDIRELIAYRAGQVALETQGAARLVQGWRADLVGHLFEELLTGQKSIRIADPTSEQPLVFESTGRGQGE
jgi:ribonuclease D